VRGVQAIVKQLVLLGLLLLIVQPEARGTRYAHRPWKEMAFQNQQVGHCWGDHGLLRTEDGGRTWRLLNGSILRALPYWGGPPWADEEDPSPHLKPVFAVSFVTPEIGWIATVGNLLGTTDGGRNWNDLTDSKAPLPALDRHYLITELQFTTVMDGWMIGEGALFRSRDGGKKWQLIRGDSCHTLHFWDRNKGLLVHYSGAIEMTFDGGDSWQSLTLPSIPHKIDGRWSFNDAANWWVADLVSVIQTRDGARSWTEIMLPVAPDEQLVGQHCLSMIPAGDAWLTRAVERRLPGGSTTVASEFFKKTAGAQFTLSRRYEDWWLIPFLLQPGEGFIITTGPISEPDWRQTSCILRTMDGGSTWECGLSFSSTTATTRD
jgi:photosystem II stability/assembly factor-like uncharacterized protein